MSCLRNSNDDRYDEEKKCITNAEVLHHSKKDTLRSQLYIMCECQWYKVESVDLFVIGLPPSWPYVPSRDLPLCHDMRDSDNFQSTNPPM